MRTGWWVCLNLAAPRRPQAWRKIVVFALFRPLVRVCVVIFVFSSSAPTWSESLCFVFLCFCVFFVCVFFCVFLCFCSISVRMRVIAHIGVIAQRYV